MDVSLKILMTDEFRSYGRHTGIITNLKKGAGERD